MTTLLESFFSRECTPYVRRLLQDALADMTAPYAHFEFNVFEVTIHRDRGVVVLSDVLVATDAGVLEVPLDAFAAALISAPAMVRGV